MDDGVIIEAIKGELESLVTLVNLALSLSLVAGAAGLRRKGALELFSLQMNRKHAFWVMVVVFLAINLGAALVLLRLADLFTLIAAHADAPKRSEAFSLLATYAWPLNPFAAHGDAGAARWYDHLGLMPLALVWWICLAATFAVRPERSAGAKPIWTVICTLLGLAFAAVTYVSFEAIRQAVPSAWPAYAASFCWRVHAAWPGITLGVVILLGVLHHRSKLRDA
jgi:hypothetical protein